jgi:hypothetical protein
MAEGAEEGPASGDAEVGAGAEDGEADGGAEEVEVAEEEEEEGSIRKKKRISGLLSRGEVGERRAPGRV